MRLRWQDLSDRLVDPIDRTPLVSADDGAVLESASGRRYRADDGPPILLVTDPLESGGWRFPAITVADEGRPRPERGLRESFLSYKRLLRRAVGEQGAGDRLVELLREGSRDRRPCVLVVGGATLGDGIATLIADLHIDVASFDVYPTDETTFVADAHRIPLADGSVDAVWIQAVLEHVYRPEDVVAEITRVLRPGGLVYVETPFLQPVHEGAYDYVRFSLSGHRLLLAGFDELESGPLGGPAAVLNLAIRGVVGGVFRSRWAARLAYALTQPLVLIDRLVPTSWRVDYATGSYFLGRLSGDPVRTFDALTEYRGAG